MIDPLAGAKDWCAAVQRAVDGASVRMGAGWVRARRWVASEIGVQLSLISDISDNALGKVPCLHGGAGIRNPIA